MKSYRDKAMGFMMELDGSSNVEIKRKDFVNILDGIISLLKQQDRDTRHACVDAVNELSVLDEGYESVRRVSVISSILNTKAG